MTFTWEDIVAIYGEERALRMLRGLEVMYVAYFTASRDAMTPQQRLVRIFSLLDEISLAA